MERMRVEVDWEELARSGDLVDPETNCGKDVFEGEMEGELRGKFCIVHIFRIDAKNGKLDYGKYLTFLETEGFLSIYGFDGNYVTDFVTALFNAAALVMEGVPSSLAYASEINVRHIRDGA